MRISTMTLGALLLAASATPALAQDATPAPDAKDAPAAAPATSEPPLFKVTGGATVISDYRFRGLTQTNSNVAVQGTINVNSKYGFYIGTWASTIDGSGKTPLLAGYGDAEVDLYGGYTKTFGNGVTVDGGLLYYYYPSAIKGLNTDFFEPYASVAYTVGPVTAKVGGNYAWGGQAGLDFTTTSDDNVYVYGEASVGIPKLPLTLKGHLGYTDGSLGLANLIVNKKNYVDWSVNLEAVTGAFKYGVTYVDTNITNRNVPIVAPNGFAKKFGYSAKALVYVGFAF